MRRLPRLSCALCLLVVLGARSAAAQGSCDSFRASGVGLALDLAPPRGFVEICSRSIDLCRDLTIGYPPELQSVAYFVKADEWRAYSTGDHRPFRNYLIAQLSTSTPPHQFDQLRDGIRTQQGPRAARPPSQAPAAGDRTQLGVLDEGRDAVVFGVVVTSKPSDPAQAPFTQVALNAAFLVKATVLSLYVFSPYQAPTDVEATRRTASTWLQCMRQANAPKTPPQATPQAPSKAPSKATLKKR